MNPAGAADSPTNAGKPISAIVLGTGRSGTSLVAGLFHRSGYFSGERFWPPSVSNPLGFFEDVDINHINEDLLHPLVPWRPRGRLGARLPLLRSRTRWGQRWLATLPPEVTVSADRRLSARIAAQTAHVPYLFKDPRFSFTLPAWFPHLRPETVFICTFREPARTVESILRHRENESYLADLRISPERAFEYWTATYENVLRLSSTLGGQWLFVHYDEVLCARAIPVLAAALSAEPDLAMPRAELRRSVSVADAPERAMHVYQTLLSLSEQKYTK